MRWNAGHDRQRELFGAPDVHDVPGHGRPGGIDDPVPDRDYGDHADRHGTTRRGPDGEDYGPQARAAAALRGAYPEATVDSLAETGAVYVSLRLDDVERGARSTVSLHASTGRMTARFRPLAAVDESTASEPYKVRP